MDILSWAQEKIEEAAVFLGFVAVAAVSFLQPLIQENPDFYTVTIRIEGGYTERMDELVDNSVHLGIIYTGTVYRTDNTRRTFSVSRSVMYQSLHDRYLLLTTTDEHTDKRFTKNKADVIRHLQSFTLEAEKDRAYSCAVSANIKVFNIDSEDLEERLWERQEPGMTFYFHTADDGGTAGSSGSGK